MPNIDRLNLGSPACAVVKTLAFQASNPGSIQIDFHITFFFLLLLPWSSNLSL
jgi:hypothetical protein